MKKILLFLISPFFIINFILALLLSYLIGIMTMGVLGFTTRTGERLEVPNVEKLSYDAAEKILEIENMGIHIMDTTPYNPKFPKYSIVRQIPKGKSYVKKGRKILVSINAGSYERIRVPSVLHLTKRQAISKLKVAGFKLGREIYVSYYGRNIILGLKYRGKTLKEGDRLPKSSKIDIVVGDGRG